MQLVDNVTRFLTIGQNTNGRAEKMNIARLGQFGALTRNISHWPHRNDRAGWCTVYRRRACRNSTIRSNATLSVIDYSNTIVACPTASGVAHRLTDYSTASALLLW